MNKYPSKSVSDFTLTYNSALTAYNTPVDTGAVGSYFDVQAHAVGAVAKEVSDYVNVVLNASSPQNADSEMLDEWLSACTLVPRRTGSFARGIATMEIEEGGSINIDPSTSFNVNNIFYYNPTKEYILTKDNNSFELVAENVGAEYNILAGTEISWSDSNTNKTISTGFFGGSNNETDVEVLFRILNFLSHVQSDSSLPYYITSALSLVSYAKAETLFISDGTAKNVVPIGVRLSVSDTIEDYGKAAINPAINEIEIKDEDRKTLIYNTLVNETSAINFLDMVWLSTQNIGQLDITVTINKDKVNDSDVNIIAEIKKQVRLALLTFKGDKVAPETLIPDFSNLETCEVLLYNYPNLETILKTSSLLDTIQIEVTLVKK